MKSSFGKKTLAVIVICLMMLMSLPVAMAGGCQKEKQENIVEIDSFNCETHTPFATSAIEYKTIGSKQYPSNPKIDEDELKDAILERVEQLQEQKKDIYILGLNWTDPDGPFEGGLDDLSDIGDLLLGIYSSGLVLYMIIYGGIRNAPTIYELVGWIILYGVNIRYTLVLFGEAFDVYEIPPGDGR